MADGGLIQSIALGIIQGLTEFLPVSSSGHLVLAQAAFGDDFLFAQQAVAFDLVLHVGTLLPVLWFYRETLGRMLVALTRDLGDIRSQGALGYMTADPDRHLAMLVVVGTLPTAVIGLLFKDRFESLFHNVGAVCVAFCVTGGLLLSTRHRGEQPTGDALTGLTAGRALLIGIAQGLAITPGISRSGSTIAVALLLGCGRETAARFSFLLSIPAICGAVVLVLKDGMPTLEAASGDALLAGFTSAAAVGYLALVMLVALVRRGGLHRFTWYLWPAAAIAYFWLGPLGLLGSHGPGTP